MPFSSRNFHFAVVVFVLSFASCSSRHDAVQTGKENQAALSETFTAAPTFSRVYSQTLSSACVECHQPGSAASSDYGVELDFTSQSAAYTTLQGTVASATSRGQCGGVQLVAAGSPKTSYLVAEIAQSYATPDFGGASGCVPAAVHYSTINLSPEQINEVVGWIQSGAQNN